MKKIAIYAICKNEEKNLDKFFASVVEADSVVVLDTGSSDTTIGILEKYEKTNPKIKVHTAIMEPFRFDVARNMCLAQVPKDVDYCVFLDIDETLEVTWYTKLQKVLSITPNITQVKMRMQFDVDADGNELQGYNQAKCHSPDDYIWKYPCHEVLMPKEGVSEVIVQTDIKITHSPDADKERDYLELLELGVQENPDDQRALYYLGREYYYKGLSANAIPILIRSINAKTMVWERQTAQSYKLLADLESMIPRISIDKTSAKIKSHRYMLNYVATDIGIPEAAFDMAMFHYERAEYQSAMSWVDITLDWIKEETETNLILRDKEVRTWRPYDLQAVLFDLQGNTARAIVSAHIAYNMCTTNERLLKNLQYLAKKIPKTKSE